MFKYIDTLRKQDVRVKTKVSFVLSVCITGVIAILWIFFFVYEFQSKPKSKDDTPSVLGGMIEDIKKTLQNNPFNDK